MGILEEKQKWKNEDFLRDYYKKEKENQDNFNQEL